MTQVIDKDWSQAEKTAKRFAKQLSIEELREIHNISIGLNPRKPKKENKEQWYSRLQDNVIHYKLWSKTFQDELKVMNKMNKGFTKRELQKAMANAIKERQIKELGVDEYLFNTVRLSLFRTMTRYFNNPDLWKGRNN